MFGIINSNTGSEAILMTQQASINILELQKRFNTEEACHKYLYEHKWPNGFECPKCKNNRTYEIKHENFRCTNVLNAGIKQPLRSVPFLKSRKRIWLLGFGPFF
jgi:hypothetical protein